MGADVCRIEAKRRAVPEIFDVFEVGVLGLVNLIAKSNGAEPTEGMKTA